MSIANRWIPALLVLLAPAAYAQEEVPNRNVRFGLPSAAKKDTSQREDYLIERPQYVLSYNAKTRSANWVSWNLTKSDLGKADRGPFQPDPLLPKGFAKVVTGVYTNSGFDRGHLCPSADRADSEENNDPTFFMTNIVPQAPNVNRQTWERMESYCRGLAKQGYSLHIVCGPHGVGGEGEKGMAEAVGKGKTTVAVPAKMWKVALVLPDDDANPRKNTRSIAVIVPNKQGVDPNWSQYRVSVQEVEKLTGFTFFRTIPEETALAIKERVDEVAVPTTKKSK